jgi:chromate transporter
VATLGILTAPCALVLMVAAWFSSVSDHAAVQGALRGLAAVVAGLIMATALRMSPAIRISPLGRGFALALVVLTFVLVGLLHVRLIWVLLALGSVSCVWAAREIRRRQ